MGRDKALLPFGDTSLLEHQAALLGRIAGSVRMVGREEMPDHRPACGPVGGIETALRTTTTVLNVVLAVDLPNVPADLLASLIDRLRAGDRSAVAVRVEGQIPLCLALRKSALGAVEAYLNSGNRSVRGLMLGLDTDFADPADFHPLFLGPETWRNLNSESDLQ